MTARPPASSVGDGPELDVRELLLALRRRAWLIALVVIVAAGLGYGLSLLQSERYEATAGLLFSEANPGERVVEGSPLDVREEPQRVAATNVALASLDTVVFRVRERLGLEMTLDEVRDRVDLEPTGQASILEITATGPTPQAATRLANVFAEEIVTFRREASKRRVQRGIDAVNRRIAAAGRESELAAGLRERRRELEVLKAVQTGDVEVAEKALPPLESSAPKPLRNGAIGALLGFIFAVILVLVLRRFDRRVRNEEEVGHILEAPVIAQIPALRRGDWQEYVYRDAFRFLRANLEFALDLNSDTAVVAVTSVAPAAGKTTVVENLGRAFSAGNRATVLLDGDLRKPMLSATFDSYDVDGVVDALAGVQPAAPMLRPTDTDLLTLLPAGSTALRSSVAQRVDGPQIRSLLSSLHHADVVLVDTAPVAIGPETSVIAAACDGVVLVVELARADRDALRFTRDQLRHAGAKIVGVVINRCEMPSKRGAYADYYGADLKLKSTQATPRHAPGPK